MIVIVNAISIKEGGSLVVLHKLLSGMTALDRNVEWHVIANIRLHDCNELALPGVTPHFFDDADRTPLHVKWWYNHTLPKLAIETGADLLFSLTNYLPDVRMPCPSLLLVQHAGHFSDLFDARMQASLSLPGRLAWRAKRRWVIRSLHKATRITVQTEALAKAIATQAGIAPEKIKVIRHGPGLVAPVQEVHQYPCKRTWHIGYISKFGVQKNFGVLIDAAAELSAAGADFSLHLTLNPAIEVCRRVIDQAKQAGIGHLLVNHGELEPEGVKDLYNKLDLFVFPSLCESFGFPMVEAMAHGIPMLVADIESNREMVGSDSLVFGCYDADELADIITTLMHDKVAYWQAATAMLTQARGFSWEQASCETYVLLTAITRERVSYDK